MNQRIYSKVAQLIAVIATALVTTGAGLPVVASAGEVTPDARPAAVAREQTQGCALQRPDGSSKETTDLAHARRLAQANRCFDLHPSAAPERLRDLIDRYAPSAVEWSLLPYVAGRSLDRHEEAQLHRLT